MRHIPNWPGNQINDINQFQEACYKTCHEKNPTDSGWYEKTDQCGYECARKTREYQIKSGKNPCEQRLQAPVFWFDNDVKESFTLKTEKDGQKTLNTIYIIIMSMFIFLLLICIVLEFGRKHET